MKKTIHLVFSLLAAIIFTTGTALAQESLTQKTTNTALLAELTDLQKNVLSEIAQKKSALVTKHLHDNVSIIPAQGMQLDKTSFIKGFVENPDIKIEAITPYDFKLGFSNSKVAVLTYKETLKLGGQPPFTVWVTITYVKEQKIWKGISVQATMTQG